MSRLTELLEQAKARDAQLGADLEREFRVLSSRLPYGLNFERHRPEAVELPGRTIRKGDKVRVLPPRGSTAKGDGQLWAVKAIHKVGQHPSEAGLQCDAQGDYPAELKDWEKAVLKAESQRAGFKFWYRNPDRPTQDSLGAQAMYESALARDYP